MSTPTDTQSATDTPHANGLPERPRPQLFVLFDRGRPLAGGARHGLANIDRVTLGRAEAREASRTSV